MPEFVRQLTPTEAAAVEQVLRSRTVPVGIYQRVLMVHWSHQGESPSQIARRLDHKFDNVRKWIRRFNAEGLAGLQERPGRGRKPQFTKADALTVVETTLTPPG